MNSYFSTIPYCRYSSFELLVIHKAIISYAGQNSSQIIRSYIFTIPKCFEVGVEDISTDEKLLDALYYDEDTTSDNIAMMMLASASRKPVTEAVANLYLRKQIVFERV